MANIINLLLMCLVYSLDLSNGEVLSIPQVEGMADLYNIAGFQFGNEVVSHKFSLKEVLLKGSFSSKSAFTRPDRPGDAVDYHSCDTITSVPRHLTFITRYGFYTRYTHAYGIPIVASSRPSDESMKRACYVLRFMLADRSILRHYLYKYYGRIGVMATTEVTTTIPEHRFLGHWWDTRARGLGGTIAVPISTGAEENLLCLPNDHYIREDIFLHEFSHGIQEIAVKGGGIPGFWERLVRQYNYAKSVGLWRNTYAMSTPQEYFGEAVQSFFDVNDYADPPNGVHGPINTRAKLRVYDPTIFRMILEVFPCQNRILDRCKRGQPIPPFRMNCDGKGKPVTSPPTTYPPTTYPRPTTEPAEMVCDDSNENCKAWAERDFCEVEGGYVQYMMKHCSDSCGCCGNGYPTCKEWKGKGYCKPGHEYAPWMKKNCKKECKVCQRIIMEGKDDEMANDQPPLI